MDAATLKLQLLWTLDSLTERLTFLEGEARKRGVSLMALVDKLGRPVAEDLVVAKANTLQSLTQLLLAERTTV